MGDGYGLIFDYYEKSLHDYIVQNQKEARMNISWFKVFRDIVIGLIFIRGLNICHNNLNPWNILLTASNVPKISGFTKAVELTDTTSRSDLIALGKLIAFSYSAKIHIFEERYKDYSPDTNRKFMYTWACEAEDVSMRLLNPRDKMSVQEVLSHPWLWRPEKRISFMNDANQLLSGLKLDHKMRWQISEFYEGPDWTTIIPVEVLNHMRSYGSKHASGNPSDGSEYGSKHASGNPSDGSEYGSKHASGNPSDGSEYGSKHASGNPSGGSKYGSKHASGNPSGGSKHASGNPSGGSKHASGNPSSGSNNSGSSSGYAGGNPRHLLKFVRNFINHMDEIYTCLPHLKLEDLYGSTPVDVEATLRLKFPRLQLGVYNFLLTNEEDVVTSSVVEGYYK